MKRVYYMDGTHDDFEATAICDKGYDCKTKTGWTTFIPMTAIKKIQNIEQG